jgi:hypothetical protein
MEVHLSPKLCMSTPGNGQNIYVPQDDLLMCLLISQLIKWIKVTNGWCDTYLWDNYFSQMVYQGWTSCILLAHSLCLVEQQYFDWRLYPRLSTKVTVVLNIHRWEGVSCTAVCMSLKWKPSQKCHSKKQKPHCGSSLWISKQHIPIICTWHHAHLYYKDSS